MSVPQQAGECSAGTEIESDELHECLHLEEVKPGTKMIFWCQMLRILTYWFIRSYKCVWSFFTLLPLLTYLLPSKAEGVTTLSAKAASCLSPHNHPSSSNPFWHTYLFISMVRKNTQTGAQHSYKAAP